MIQLICSSRKCRVLAGEDGKTMVTLQLQGVVARDRRKRQEGGNETKDSDAAGP